MREGTTGENRLCPREVPFLWELRPAANSYHRSPPSGKGETWPDRFHSANMALKDQQVFYRGREALGGKLMSHRWAL